MPYAFDYAARSVIGLVRSSNQDSAYASPNLLVVADGMGGHAGGDVASTIAVETIKRLDHPGHTPATALADLENALDHSQLALMRASDTAPQLQGLGTTVVCLLRTETTLVMAHMGDSRAYLLRDGQLSQVTVDHTFVQHLVDIGRITPAEAETHPQRNVVMRVLSDFDLDLHPDVSVREAKVGDRWLLCSDGLSGFVTPAEMLTILAGISSPDDAADILINKALHNQSNDNVTCLVADIVDPQTHFGTDRPTSDDPSATVELVRPIPSVQIVGAAATGGPLPDLVAAVVAGEEWDDDLHDDAELMSEAEIAEHILTGPTPIIAPSPMISVNAEVDLAPLAESETDLNSQSAVNLTAPEVIPAAAGLPTSARLDPLYLSEDDDPSARTPHQRRRPWITVGIIATLALALVIGLWRGYAWTQRQYFIGLHESRVAVFQGFPQHIGPVSLYHPILIYDIDATTFPVLFQTALTDTIPVPNREEALARAEQLIIDARAQMAANQRQSARPGATSPASPTNPPLPNPEPIPAQSPGSDSSPTQSPEPTSNPDSTSESTTGPTATPGTGG